MVFFGKKSKLDKIGQNVQFLHVKEFAQIVCFFYSLGVELCHEADRRDPLITKGTNMNGYTKEIAEFLNVSLEDAKKVQDYMEEELDIDYSECSDKTFKNFARIAAFHVNVTPVRPCMRCNKFAKECAC